MDIAEFIKARLDEDQRTAQAAQRAGSGFWLAGVDGDVFEDENRWVCGADEPDATHIMRWDPATVLREVSARRVIADLHRPRFDSYIDGDGIERGTYECRECMPPGTPDNWPCRTIAALASAYSGHRDYDPSWKREP